MKLMLCLECGDIVQLRTEPRACLCGAASGRYVDEANVEQTAGTVSIALHNHDLGDAVRAFQSAPEVWHPLFCFRAYINPLCEPDVRYVAAEPGPDEQP